MCKLEHMTYACGHTRLTLLSSCEYTFRRESAFSKSLELCRAGTQVDTRLTSQVACKADCPRKEAQEAIKRRYNLAKAKMDLLSQRVQKVSLCLKKTEKKGSEAQDRKLFGKLAHEGFDAKKLVELCKIAIDALHKLLREFGTEKAQFEAELEAGLATAKASVKNEEIVTADGMTTELVSFNAGELEKMGNGSQLPDIVRELERRAVDACFEEFGWEMPKEDKDHYDTMKDLGAWKKGLTSGSMMCDAFVGRPAKRIVYTT